MPKSDDRLLTLDEVAKKLKVSRRTVNALVHAGRLPVVQIGYKIKRVTPAALENFIQAHERTGPPKRAAAAPAKRKRPKG